MRKAENALTALFRQYLAGTLSPEDHAAFLQLISDNTTEEELKDLIDHAIAGLDSQPEALSNGISAQRAEEIFTHIIEEKEEARIVVFRKKRTIIWSASAAAVLLLVAGFLFFKQPPPPPPPVAVEPVSNDVKPGVTGAVLTLANGKKILLDTLHNGDVGNEGGISITKQDGGITYQPGWVEKGKVVYNTLTTPRAYQYQLTLPDGTKVWLNAESSIVYPTAFTGKERMITVTGETYFEVVENKQQPFFVRYGNNKVEVVGTHFNVNAYQEENDSRVTLLQGAIKLNNGTNTGVLKPGQQAILNKANEAIRIINDVDTDQVMAWKNGHFDFRETDLKTLMRQLMRWYDVDVEYQQGVPDRYFTADVSRNKNLSAVLQILELNKIHFKIDNRKIIVTP